jgi:hypothetical protein
MESHQPCDNDQSEIEALVGLRQRNASVVLSVCAKATNHGDGPLEGLTIESAYQWPLVLLNYAKSAKRNAAK